MISEHCKQRCCINLCEDNEGEYCSFTGYRFINKYDSINCELELDNIEGD